MGINVLIISVIAIQLDLPIYTTLIIIFPSFVSAWYILQVLRIRDYERPGKHYEDFYQYAKMTEQQVRDRLILDYMTTLETNSEKNDEKADRFHRAYMLSTAALFLALIGIVADGIAVVDNLG